MRIMEKITNQEIKQEQKGLKKQREDLHYERLIFEVYYFSILQHAIYSTDHKKIAKLKEFYEKQGYDFNKYFSSAEKQLRKIKGYPRGSQIPIPS